MQIVLQYIIPGLSAIGMLIFGLFLFHISVGRAWAQEGHDMAMLQIEKEYVFLTEVLNFLLVNGLHFARSESNGFYINELYNSNSNSIVGKYADMPSMDSFKTYLEARKLPEDTILKWVTYYEFLLLGSNDRSARQKLSLLSFPYKSIRLSKRFFEIHEKLNLAEYTATVGGKEIVYLAGMDIAVCDSI